MQLAKSGMNASAKILIVSLPLCTSPHLTHFRALRAFRGPKPHFLICLNFPPVRRAIELHTPSSSARI